MKIVEKICLPILLTGFLGLIVPCLEAREIKVKCDKGDSVQKVIDDLVGPATIIVTGTCYENIDIFKDDVTIEGGTFIGQDPQQTTIYIEAARRIYIRGATVGGARSGIVAYQGSSVTIESSMIQGNAGAGVVAIFGSSTVVSSSTIQNNAYEGLSATDNSAIVLVNSTISSNGRAGVSVARGSSARIGQNSFGVAGPNTIQNNGTGISVYQASQAMIANNTIRNNTRDGVLVEGGSARLTNNSIVSNWKGVEVSSGGNARIGINDDGSAGIGNTIGYNQLEGISIANGGSAYMLNNQIIDNGQTMIRPGVGVYRASARLVGGNTIKGAGGHGIEVNQGTLFQGKGDWNFTTYPDIIIQNGRSGISAWNLGSLDIQHATIASNNENGIVLNLRSSLRIFGSTVSDNTVHGVAVYDGSAAAFYHPSGTLPASITGNSGWGLFCWDNESSCTGDLSGVADNNGGQVSCSGF